MIPSVGAVIGDVSGILHRPVMVKEVVNCLVQDPDGIYIDGTIGGGGHTEAILKRLSSKGKVIGIDWDEDAIEVARKRLSLYQSRQLFIVRANFVEMEGVVRDLGIDGVDGILLDLGLSSIHIEKKGRGFSFLKDEPLDMRMDRRNLLTASRLVNESSEEELARIFLEYGEERWARRIAKAICKKRAEGEIRTTKELSEIVSSAIPKRYHPRKIHPATKVFQALRIAVNDELNNLKKAIEVGVDLLRQSGRFCIISFHSLEDRVVKEMFKSFERGCICPPDIPRCQCGRVPKLKLITKRPFKPSHEEVESNPRARSARLRVAERV